MQKIQIKSLTKKYDENFNILNNIDVEFDLKKSPIIIIGEDLSGKTTLLNILTGIDKAYCGEVYFDDQNLKDISFEKIKVSYIMQKDVFFENKSLYKNLEYVFKVYDKNLGKAEVDKQIKEVCEEFMLFGELDKKLKRCSPFVRKMAGLARACLKKSELIIMDEVFSGLNFYEKAALWQRVVAVIDKLSCGVVVAEKGQNLALFDGFKIYKMSNGEILS